MHPGGPIRAGYVCCIETGAEPINNWEEAVGGCDDWGAPILTCVTTRTARVAGLQSSFTRLLERERNGTDYG